MDRMVDSGINLLNAVGQAFSVHAGSAFVQSSVLIGVLLVLDVLLRKRVRAVVRYSVWMLVFVKLLLPPALALPTGIGYYWPGRTTVLQEMPASVAVEAAPAAIVKEVRPQPVPVVERTPSAAEISEAHAVPRDTAPTSDLPVNVRPAATWQAWVFLSWLSGVLALGICLLRRFQYVRKLVRESTAVADPLQGVLAQCAAKLGLRRCPQLRLSDEAPGPVVCRLLRPAILMPTTLADGMSEGRLRTVLVHELAHIKRADLWVNFVQTLLLVAYFYHPLLWLANAIVRRLREQAVDEMVLVALEAEARSYSTTLIDLAEMTFDRPILGLRLIGIAESRKALEGRIRHMMARPKPKTAKLGVVGVFSVGVVAAVLLPMAAARSNDEPQGALARLPNGVSIELVGVCDWPENGRRCWRPDGSPLAPEIYATKSNKRPGPEHRGFMLKATGPDSMDLSWNKIAGTGGWEGSCNVADGQGNRLEGYTAAIADMETDLAKTEIRVGIATGPWQTIARHDGKRMNSGREGGVLWSQAFETSGGVHIVASAQWDKSRTERVVAIDRQGALHATQHGSVASGNVDQLTATFRDLQRDDIAEFQFQVRPYAWVEFKDVSLRPGEQTKVRVEAGLREKPEYARLVIEEGVGFDGLVVGDTTCTAALIKSKLGEPEEEQKKRATGWWLSYRDMYGLDFWLRLNTGSLAEIRCNRGFKGHLRSGISMASTRADVFNIYGQPLAEKTVLDLTKHFDNQVLYKRLLSRSENSKIFYTQHGLLFWFEGEKIRQIVIHPRQSEGTARSSGPPRGAATDMEARLESQGQLMKLGKALLIYANDHDDTFPEQLSDLRDEVGVGMSWLRENATYLGKGVSPRGDPARILAYDKVLLKKGGGTNVLYLDSHVAFESAERLKELWVGTADESLPNIFIMSSSRVGFDVFGEIISRTRDWTWNKTGRNHSKESYDEIFDGTHNRTSHDILVLVFALDADERIPADYEDLLPRPWAEFQRALRQGRTVELSTEAMGLHVIVLAAPGGEQLKQLIAQSRLLSDSKDLARSAVTGCDVAIEDFKVRADPDLGTYAASASIRNRGAATSPKFTVNFYRGDPETARPVSHGAGPIKPGQVWNESSSQFGLREGLNNVHVVLDPANLVEELDETNNRASLRIIIRDGQIAEQSIVSSAPPSVSLEVRGESRARLTDLGKVLLFYTVDHDGKLPEKIEDVRDDVRMAMWWLVENVAYLGQGMTTRDNPERPVAYDKTLIQSGNGTNVLYLNSQVIFENPARLAELGIKPMPKSAEEIQEEAAIQTRVVVLSHLKQLALAAIMYADEHGGMFADDVQNLEAYVSSETLFAWVRQNAEYVARGARLAGGMEASKKPLAYWRTAPVAMSGTAVAFQDGHVEIVRGGPRLKELGIDIEP